MNAFFAVLVRSLEGDEHAAVLSALGEKAARVALEAASRDGMPGEERARRVHTWFDAFHTRKVVHALRDRVYPSVQALDALRAAPFRPPADGDAAIDGLLPSAFSNDEQRRSVVLGLPVVSAHLISGHAGPGAVAAGGAAAPN